MTDEPRPGSLSGRLHASTTVLVVEDEQDIAGFLGAYAETLQKGARPAPATPESAGPTIEVDVTESATRGGRARQRVAG